MISLPTCTHLIFADGSVECVLTAYDFLTHLDRKMIVLTATQRLS